MVTPRIIAIDSKGNQVPEIRDKEEYVRPGTASILKNTRIDSKKPSNENFNPEPDTILPTFGKIEYYTRL